MRLTKSSEDKKAYQREYRRQRRASMPVYEGLKVWWSLAETLRRGEKVSSYPNHHRGMRMLKYGTSWAPPGEHLNRLCDARTCDDVYAIKSAPSQSGTMRLLCTNPEHYESGPPDGGSEMRYMRESGRL